MFTASVQLRTNESFHLSDKNVDMLISISFFLRTVHTRNINTNQNVTESVVEVRGSVKIQQPTSTSKPTPAERGPKVD